MTTLSALKRTDGIPTQIGELWGCFAGCLNIPSHGIGPCLSQPAELLEKVTVLLYLCSLLGTCPGATRLLILQQVLGLKDMRHEEGKTGGGMRAAGA